MIQSRRPPVPATDRNAGRPGGPGNVGTAPHGAASHPDRPLSPPVSALHLSHFTVTSCLGHG
ncbi:hypothetical protein NK326_23995, partial [Salmonella enterica]|nr:hypothetical protein [Salmonella enterica]